MKKIILFISLLMCISFTGCKKDNVNNNDSKYVTLQTTTNDNNDVDKIVDESLNDAENLMISSKSTLCNIYLDSTKLIGDTITKYFTYNGPNCNNTFSRVGKVEIKFHKNTHWIDTNSTIFIKHINFKITKISNGEWKIFNSDKKHINISGGLFGKRRTTGYVNITFPNNDIRFWNITRQKTITLNNNNLQIKIEGFGNADGYNNLVTWGINRDGENFYSRIDSVVIFKQECDWNPCTGIRFITIPSDNKSAVITYGYKNYQPTTSSECPTQYRFDWIKGTNTGTVFINL